MIPRFIMPLLGLCALLLWPAALTAQAGTVEGRVIDARTGDLLSGAEIVVEGTDLSAVSASDGRFDLQQVPAGSHTVRVSSLGYGTISRQIRVRDGEAVRLEIELAEEAVEVGGITVVGRRRGFVESETLAGTKVATSLAEVPQSISVITAERIQSQGAETQAEALRYAAGVQSESFGPDILYDWTQIRGFQQYGQNLFRDGMQLRSASQATLRLNPYGAERIEVLRGPASVLYGQSSAGGFVHYVSKKPSIDPAGEVELQLGSYDWLQGAVDVTGPLNDEGTLLYRLTGLVRDAEGQVDFTENDTRFVAPALTWQLAEGTSLTVLGDVQREDAVRGTSFLPASGTVAPNPHGTIPVHRNDGIPGFDGFVRDQYSFGYLFEHAFDDGWTLRSNARRTSMDNDYQIAWGGGLQDDERTMNRFWFSGTPSLDITTVDNHLAAEFAFAEIEHRLLFGLDYQRHVLDERFEMGPATPLDVFDPDYEAGDARSEAFFTSDVRREQSQFGAYLQDQIEWNAWTLVLSGRHDRTDTENVDRTADATTEQSNDAFTGRVGLVYRTDAGVVPYASYSESFLPLLGADASGEDFEPEEGRQYEVGMKYQPAPGSAFVTLAAFDLLRRNVLTPDPDNSNFQTQEGEIRSRGIEVEGVASLTSELDMTASYAFIDAEILESNAGDEGNRPIIVPEHEASVWADYTHRGGALDGLGAGGGVRYTGESYGDPANTLEIPGRTLLDATFHYDWDAFRFGLSVDNVLDEPYVASCSGPTACFYGTARTARGELRYRW